MGGGLSGPEWSTLSSLTGITMTGWQYLILLRGNGHGSNITPRYNCYSLCYTMLHVHVTEEC